MSPRILALLLAPLAALPGRAASALEPVTSLDERARGLERPPPNLSHILLDGSAETRFHLTTRARFSEGEESFGPGSTWGFELKVLGRVLDGLALGVVLPFALDAPRGSGSEVGLVGNLRVSLAASAGRLRLGARDTGPSLGLTFGLDAYAPTGSSPDSGCSDRSICPNAARAAALSAYEPELYLRDAVMGRPRAQLDLQAGAFRAAIEAALVPGIYALGPREGDAFLRYGFASRLSLDVAATAQPFVEVVAGGTLSHPPLVPGTAAARGGFDPDAERIQVNVGTRLFAKDFAPAVFATVEVEPAVVFFGVDLAGVVRPPVRRRERFEAGFGR